MQEGGYRVKNVSKGYSVPDVTIITVVRNGSDFIEQTILSVVNQTYNNIEYLVIDGNSTDKTVEIIKRYNDKIAYWLSENDKGIYDAMNKGIRLATGKWIGILNCGDYFVKSSTISDLFLNNTYDEFELIYGNMFMRHVFPGDSRQYNQLLLSNSDFRMLKKKFIVGHGSCFFKRTCIEKNGDYDLSFKIAADTELLLRYLKNGIRWKHINIPVHYFDTSGVSYKKIYRTRIEEFLAYRKHFNFFHSLTVEVKPLLALVIMKSMVLIMGKKKFMEQQKKKLQLRNTVKL